MQTAIEHGPSFAWLRVQLGQGDSIEAEAGAMVSRSPAVTMDTRLNAGRGAGFLRKLKAIFVAIVRKVLGGETLFVNTFSGQGEVVLAPALSGSIVQHSLSAGSSITVQAGSYLASTGNIDAKLKLGGLKALFSGEGLFFLECGGEGELFVNAYGGIVEVPVNGSYVVDTGHLVAFDSGLDYAIRSVGGGMMGFFASGEGLVMEFKGKGTLYLQSRNLSSLVGWINPFLRG